MSELKCQKCEIGCKTCELNNDGECDSCLDGYLLDAATSKCTKITCGNGLL